jgi:surface-adhesin protein E
MTRSRLSLLGFSALLAALSGCGTPATTGGAPNSFAAGPKAAPTAPGPGWLLLGSHREGDVFIHPLSTLRVGSSAFIMLVVSKRQPAVLPGGVVLGSARERLEIDCERSRYRRHDGTVHADQIGSGPVLGRIGQDQWKDAAPGTVIAAVSRAVCAGTTPPSATPPTEGPGFAPAPVVPRVPKARGGTFST